MQRLARGRAELGESFALGLVILGAWLQLLDLVGVSWSPVTVLLPAALAFVLERTGKHGVARSVQNPRAQRSIQPWSWGEWMAAMGVGLFAWSAFTLRSMSPDFVYHWGVKGRRFFELGAIDWAFLERTGAGYLHPDYPLLVSSVYGATATIAGTWSETSLMLLSVAAAALLVLEARSILQDAAGDSWALDSWQFAAGVATVSLVLMAFSMAHEQAGAADILFGLSATGLSRRLLLLASPTWTKGQSDDLSDRLLPIGVWAALAVATKIEGVPLAVFALSVASGLVLAKRNEAGRRGSLESRLFTILTAWRLWALPLVVGAWWLGNVYRHDLFQSSNFGVPNVERVRSTLDALPQALSLSSWSGLAWLIVAVPVLLLARPPASVGGLRILVLLPALQLGFYLFTYFGGEQNTTFWVLSSFPRLVFHLMPVTLVAVMIALSSQRSLGRG